MANSAIAKAYVQIVPTTKGIRSNIASELSDGMGSAGESSGKTFGSGLVSTIKSTLVTAGLGKALMESIDAGAALQQSLGGVETLFKDSADTVIANAENAYKTAGMSANEYMETVTGFSASLLQGLSGDTEKAAAVADMALTDMADNANKFGTDMEAIQNAYQGFAKQNYTMLDNLKLGYGGTKSEMERLLEDARKLSGVEYNIDNLADVYSAIHVIQEEMGVTGTTAKEASTTFSGSLASMKAAFSDLLGQMALRTEDLTPYFDALSDTVFTFVRGNLLPMVGNILDSLPTIISGSLSMVVRGLNILSHNTDSILRMGIDLVTGIGEAIITALPYLAEAAWNVVASLGNAIVATDWIQIGQDTIRSLQSSLDLAAGDILGTDGNIVQSILDAVSANLPAVLEGGVGIVIEMANGLLQGLPGFLETVGDLMDQMLGSILAMLPDILDCGIELIGSLADGLVENAPAVVGSIGEILGKLLATLVEALPDLLEKGFELVCELAAGLIKGIPDAVAAIPQLISGIVDEFMSQDWGAIGKDILSGIASGIINGGSAIVDAAKSAARSALDAAKKFLGIASPSKVMRDQVGKWIPSGMAAGIEGNTRPLTDAMHDLSDLTTDTLQADLRLDSAVPAAAPSCSYGDTNLTLQIYAAENQDVDELAEIIMEKIQFAVAKREASFA